MGEVHGSFHSTDGNLETQHGGELATEVKVKYSEMNLGSTGPELLWPVLEPGPRPPHSPSARVRAPPRRGPHAPTQPKKMEGELTHQGIAPEFTKQQDQRQRWSHSSLKPFQLINKVTSQ